MRYGYRIDFNGKPILPQLKRKTRNTIQRAGREIEYIRNGTLNELKTLHWNPTYLPKTLGHNQKIFLAILDDSLPPISAVLVEECGDHVVYRYSGNDKNYSKYNGNTFLLWYIAEIYNEKLGYKYLDLGGSKKPNIEAFKRRLSTSRYPLKERPFYMVLWRKIEYHLKEAFLEPIF